MSLSAIGSLPQHAARVRFGGADAVAEKKLPNNDVSLLNLLGLVKTKFTAETLKQAKISYETPDHMPQAPHYVIEFPSEVQQAKDLLPRYDFTVVPTGGTDTAYYSLLGGKRAIYVESRFAAPSMVRYSVGGEDQVASANPAVLQQYRETMAQLQETIQSLNPAPVESAPGPGSKPLELTI